MDDIKKNERIQLLTAIGEEVHQWALSEHCKQGGDPQEIVFNRDAISNVVEDYAAHLEIYRNHHIGKGKLVDGDKIAAFTGTLIMRNDVFVSETGEINTPIAALVNETFAVRVAQLFVQKKRFGFNPPDEKQLMLCFGRCYDHDPAMVTWAVATMSQHIKFGTVSETSFSD